MKQIRKIAELGSLYWNVEGSVLPIRDHITRHLPISIITKYARQSFRKLVDGIDRGSSGGALKRRYGSGGREGLVPRLVAAALCGAARWLATVDGSAHSLSVLRFTTLRLRELAERWPTRAVSLRRVLEELYHWLELLALTGDLAEWRASQRDVTSGLVRRLNDDLAKGGQTHRRSHINIRLHYFILKLLCIRLLEPDRDLGSLAKIFGPLATRVISSLSPPPPEGYDPDENRRLQSWYDLQSARRLITGRVSGDYESLLDWEASLVPPRWDDMFSHLEKVAEVWGGSIVVEDDELVTTLLSVPFLDLERHRLARTLNRATSDQRPYEELVGVAIAELFDQDSPREVTSESKFRSHLVDLARGHPYPSPNRFLVDVLIFLGQATLWLHSLIRWYEIERIPTLPTAAVSGDGAVTPGVAPIQLYPLWESLPSLPDLPVRLKGFKRQDDTEWTIAADHARSYVPLSLWSESTFRLLVGYAQEERDDETGFLRLDPTHGPLGDLGDVEMFVYAARVLGWLREIERESQLRWDEVCDWILHNAFAATPDVFVGLHWEAKELASGLAILHMLDRTDGLYDVCDAERLAGGFGSLQARDGYFLSRYGAQDRDGYLPSTHACLKALGLLEATVCPGALSLIHVDPLTRYLHREEHYREPKAEYADDRRFRMIRIRSLYLATACWQILSRPPLSVPMPDSLRTKVLTHVKALFGIPQASPASHIASPLGNLLEVLLQEHLSRSTVTEQPDGDSQHIYDLPSIAYLYAFGIVMAIETEPALLTEVFRALKVRELSKRHTGHFPPLAAAVVALLRHLPVLTITTDPSLFLFEGEDHVELSLTNLGSKPVLGLRIVPQAEEYLFSREDGDGLYPVSFGNLTSAVAIDHLPAGPRWAIHTKLPVSREPLWEDAVRSMNGRRYGPADMCGLTLECSQVSGQERIDFQVEIERTPVWFLPQRQAIENCVRDALVRSQYDEVTAIAQIRKWLRDHAQLDVTQEMAGRLLHMFYPSLYPKWIQQFEGRERLLAERLFSALTRYTEDDLFRMSEECLQRLQNRVPDALHNTEATRIVGLGHTGKSGNHALYFFHHAVNRIDPSIETRNLFRPLSPSEPLPPGSVVIFVDDLIGSGTQAQKYFRRLFSTEEGLTWLHQCRLYYLAWVALQDSIPASGEWAPKGLPYRPRIAVLWSRIVTEAEKPFSSKSKLFPAKKDREAAKQMARWIGMQILPDSDEYNVWRNEKGDPDTRVPRHVVRKRHALGWRGSQALIVFPYNTPNNTLPIFWARGQYRGEAWIPLFRRREK